MLIILWLILLQAPDGARYGGPQYNTYTWHMCAARNSRRAGLATTLEHRLSFPRSPQKHKHADGKLPAV
jgi:hypothetical protein